MNKKLLLLLAAGTLSATLVLGACGNNDDSSSSSSSAASLHPANAVYISNESELLAIGNDLEGYYVLSQNITLSAPISPIGGAENEFKGTLDGDGYTVSNLSFTNVENVYDAEAEEGDAYAGLFGVNKGTIRNVNFEINYTDSFGYTEGEHKIYIGSACGYNKKGTLENISVSGSINVTDTENGSLRIGGLAGKTKGTTVSNCTSSVSIEATTSTNSLKAGSLLGVVEEATVENCSASGNINVTSGRSVVAGGLIGEIDTFGTVTDCYATGNSVGFTYSSKSSSVGGLVGYCGEDEKGLGTALVEIKNSYATGNSYAWSESGNAAAGGVVGRAEASESDETGDAGTLTVTHCYGLGNGTANAAAGKAYACGIVGRNDATVTDCYYSSTATYTIEAGSDKTKANGEAKTIAEIEAWFNA